ncbi:hypothetical protein SAMN05216249_10122 [Acetitomaculum ruminis DSM 5522]|uniref:Uncharacterized protein n=1 Tax=Acetitomaculum ruminis DSM 5522 TaxID=1120918 RepID=A0A1I0UY97_9FIRM|nr:hypothetical protein SAMN05216249_10122 [Acetitomaculum ruminis DSM 5522]
MNFWKGIKISKIKVFTRKYVDVIIDRADF